jgi:hypothetical protein
MRRRLSSTKASIQVVQWLAALSEENPMDAAAIKISLFDHLVTSFGERIEILPSTKATLVHLSHAIEDLVLRGGVGARGF